MLHVSSSLIGVDSLCVLTVCRLLVVDEVGLKVLRCQGQCWWLGSTGVLYQNRTEIGLVSCLT